MTKQRDMSSIVALEYLFVSRRAEELLETFRKNRVEFVGELLKNLTDRWPTESSLKKCGRVIADCRGKAGQHLKFVVEPQLKAIAVFTTDEPAPTSEKIGSLIEDGTAVESPFVPGV